MDDIKIIELFWNRDETALKEVENKYNHFCFKIAWKSIPPARPSILSAFLGRITRNFAIDNLRKKYAAKRTDLHIANFVTDITKEVETLNQQVAYSLDEHIEEKELIRLINTFLEGLRERDRDIFIRRYWHMDSIADISKRHGESTSSIKSNLYRTRNKLKKVLMKERYYV